jgi:predicted nucleic acid binding AN1-type Zn finger protein
MAKNTIEKKSSRCHVCSKKLDLASRSTLCRCEHIFCSEHRQAEDHNCSFDFKTNQMTKLSSDLLSAKTSTRCIVEEI